MTKRKYRKGDRVATIGEAADAIIAGACLYFNDKPQNYAWVQNMSLWAINRYVAAGRVWRAVENKDDDA